MPTNDPHLGLLNELGLADSGEPGLVDVRWVRDGELDPGRIDAAMGVITRFFDLAAGGPPIGDDAIVGLMRAVFDESSPARGLRDVMVRGHLEPDDLDKGHLDPRLDPRFPDGLIPIEDFVRIGCVRDLQAGLATVGGLMRDVPRPRPKQGAVITAVTPERAGVGDRVTILGSGFGAQPARDEAVRRAGYLQAHGHDVDHVHPGGAPQTPKQFYGGCDPARTGNVHVRETGSPHYRAALLLRDWLRSSPEERQGYAVPKRALAAPTSTTREYAEAKEPWFRDAYPRALARARDGVVAVLSVHPPSEDSTRPAPRRAPTHRPGTTRAARPDRPDERHEHRLALE